MNNNTAIVKKMFGAFGEGNIEALLTTVSHDTIWIHHGTHILPKETHHGFEGVRSYISNILENSDALGFEPQEYITEADKVVVLGQEHQRIKKTGQELKQKWVMIYTIKEGLISRLEEFAVTEVIE